MPFEISLPDSGQDQKAITQQSFKVTAPDDSVVGRTVSNVLNPPPESYDPQAIVTTTDAARTTPEAYAKTRDLAARSGLPVPTVARNEADIAAQEKAKAMRDLMLTNPIYRQQMTNPDFAKLAADDGLTLSKVESWKNATGPEPSVGSVVSGLARALPQGVEGVRQGTRQQFADLFGFKEMAQDAARKAAQNTSAEFLSTPNFASDTAQGVYGGAQSFIQQLPALAASILTANPTPAIGGAFVQAEATAYSKYRARGATGGEAIVGAGAEGVLEAATELIPMKYIVNRLGKAGAGEFLAGLLARELPLETANTIAQGAVDTAIANPDKTWGQYFADLPGDVYQTGISVITQAILTAGLGKGAQVLAGRDRGELKSKQNADAMKELFAIANDAKVRTLAPNTFAKFVDEAHPNSAVYVDAATFKQEIDKAGVSLATMPETAAALPQALAMKTDVRIPLGELAATAPGTALEQAIIPHLRADVTAPTQQEIADKKYAEETEAKTATILADENFTDSFKQSAEVVRNELLTQLNQANRFTPDVNKAKAAYATAIYTTQAKRLGITPEQMYVKYPLDVVARGLPTDTSFEAPPFDSAPIAEYGEAKPNSVSVPAVHFSPQENLSVLDSRFYGRGIAGAESARLEGLPPESKYRTYFYVPAGEGVTPEAGLGGNVYGVKLNNLYDTDADPLRIVSNDGNKFEKAVRDAGYNGYYVRNRGVAVVLGQHTIPVSPLGDLASANAQMGSLRAPEAVLDQQRKASNALDARRTALPGGQMSPAEWNDAIQASAADVWPYIPQSVWQGTAPLYLSDILKAINNAPVSAYQQEGVSSTWAYSELARQIDAVKMQSAPPQGWKDYIRGLTQKGVKPAEIEATGINDWLDALTETKPAAWYVVGADGARLAGPYDDEQSAKTYITFIAERRSTDGIITEHVSGEPIKKVTKEQVQKYLKQNQLVLREHILDGSGATDSDFTMGDFEVDDPDPSWISERASENLDDFYRERYAELKGIPEEDVDEDDLQEYAEEQEREAYYDDSESPQSTTATLTVDGRDYDFTITQAYDSTSIYDQTHGRTLALHYLRDDDYEGVIREYLSDNYDIESSEGDAPQYEQYVSKGPSDSYVEILLSYPDGNKYSAPHFGDNSLDENLMVHFRANSREVPVTELDASFPELAKSMRETGRTTANVFFVEEIQSDWAQAGREEGFGRPLTDDEKMRRMELQQKERTPTEEAELYDLNRALNGVASAPFVTNSDAITSLAVKRILRHAIENGHDVVAWTRGDQQTARWSGALRKHVDEIHWEKTSEGVHLTGYKVAKIGTPSAALLPHPQIFSQPNGVFGVRRGDDVVAHDLTESEAVAFRSLAVSYPYVQIVQQPDVAGEKQYYAVDARGIIHATMSLRANERMLENLTFEELGTTAFAKNPRREVVNTTYAESALSDAIGKAMGRQILADPAQSGTISGEGITIDKAGMPQVYGDSQGKRGDGGAAVIPKSFAAVSKKLGGTGKVGSVQVDLGYRIQSAETRVEPLTRAESERLSEYTRAESTRLLTSEESADLVTLQAKQNNTPVGHYAVLDGDRSIVGNIHDTEDAAAAVVRELQAQPAIELTPALKANVMKGVSLFQNARGQITFSPAGLQQPTQLALLANANLSTFFHEMGHFYLEVLNDMAAQPDAPQSVKNDMDIVLKWFGVTADQWSAMSLEERRPYHEQFARGNEAYLFEGKAPSIALQGMFQRFRAWMLNVYTYLTGGSANSDAMQTGYAKATGQPLLKLTDEVRGVLDRMLATNEEILDAEDAQNFLPIFDSKPEGVTDDAWKAYHELGADASQQAVDELQTRSLKDMKYASNARAQVLKRLQQQAATQRRAVKTEVTAEVKAEPAYQAQRFLRTGKVINAQGEEVKTDGSFKLNRAAVEVMYPEGMVNRPPLDRIQGLIAKDGLAPETVAELFGMGSADELVRKLADLEPMNEKIAGMTDQRMLERYGDLADPASIAAAADEAVHNEVRTRFVATELHMLEKAVGQKKTLLPAAKAFAETMIARKRLRDIRPSQYSAAAARAARNAKGVQEDGDIATAAAEKRTQIVNIYAARAAHEARDEVERGIALLKREGESKSIDVEYRDQINALLDRFDLKKISEREAARRESLVNWIAAQRAANQEPTIDPALENEANRKPYQSMTLEEFRGLVDSVKNIAHLGRLKNRMVQARDKRELAMIVAEAAQTIHDNAKRSLPVVLERNSTLQRIKDGKDEYFAMHIKFASMIREMDGYEDNGVLWNLFTRGMNEAGTNEAVMNEQATMKLIELMKPIENLKMGEKQWIPEINASLSREARIAVALNTGTEGNLQRLKDGDHWTDQQVQAIVDTLTKSEMDFVQSVWDFVGSYKQQVADQQRRLTGVEPEWIDPRVVQTKHGEYKGGYYPAKYDGTRSVRALADEAAAGLLDQWKAKYGAASARASFTKGRANAVVDRPLKKSLGVLTQHITEVTHRLAWQDWLVDTNRLLRAKPIQQAISEHYGHHVAKVLSGAVEDIAAGDIPAQNVFESGINYVRQGATIAGLGWRVTTSLLQPLGLTQSMVRIGPKWVGRGIAEWLGTPAHMNKIVDGIYEKSDFMRLRGKTMQREVSEIRNKISDKNSNIEASYFYLIQKMQMVADVPTWLGQYEKSIAAGVPEDAAVAQADQAVLDAQGGGQMKDLSAIQRGGPMLKLWTNFYSFFNTTYNLQREAVGKTDFKNAASVGALAVNFLLLWVIPAVLGTLIKHALGDDDDKNKLARNLISDQLGYLMGSLVGFRELGGLARAAAGLPGDYGGPAGLRFITEATKFAKQAGQGELDEAFWKSLANTVGIFFHLPSGQTVATLDGIAALSDGKTDNPGVLLVGSSKK